MASDTRDKCNYQKHDDQAGGARGACDDEVRGRHGAREDRTNVRKIGGGDHYFFTPTHVPYACVIDFVLAPRKNMTHSTLFDIRTFRDGDA